MLSFTTQNPVGQRWTLALAVGTSALATPHPMGCHQMLSFATQDAVGQTLDVGFGRGDVGVVFRPWFWLPHIREDSEFGHPTSLIWPPHISGDDALAAFPHLWVAKSMGPAAGSM